jgi:IS30 family transposase
MERAIQAILDSLAPRRRRSKLEPYAALIRALRARRRSYREIVTILRERCGLRVSTHTVYHFVRVRAQKKGARRPPRRQPSGPVQRASEAGASSSPCSPDRPEDVWRRIAAVKRRMPASAAEPKAFEFDEHEPLQLMAEDTPRKR